MLDMLQILPLRLYLVVGLHLNVGLAPLEAILLIPGNQIVEQQGIGALLLILGQDANEHQVQALSLVEL